MGRTSRSNIIQVLEDGTLFVSDETPTGSIDGANTSFTLAGSPNPATSLEVFFNGQLQALSDDYSLSGTTLTLVVAIPTGTTLRVNYRVEP